MTQRDAGLYAGIPNDTYHGGPGISKSGLDLINRSPLHYRYATDARNDNDDQAETRWQRIGQLVHQLILEPADIWKEYAHPFVAPDGVLRTSDDVKEQLRLLGLKVSGTKADLIDRLRDADPAAKFYDDAYAEWDADRGDRKVINVAELEAAEAMAAAVEGHPLAASLFLSQPGDPELSAYWTDPATGVLCRCRPDWWRADGVLVDVKTTEDASPENFARSINNYRYHVQAAYYLDGVREAVRQNPGCLPPGVIEPREIVFLAIEKKAPHAVAVYRIDDEALEIGRREYRQDLDRFAQCEKAGVWPGYGDALQRIALPDWRMRRAEFEGQ